jgi:5-methylcytosine-specific restriction enzyme subunit McrC
MTHYGDSLAWARLLLDEDSPLTGSGRNRAPSLLFPMEAVFEAYVAKHLPAQLTPHLYLSTQARSHHLVRHLDQDWFLLKPDLVIRSKDKNLCVLDTKWKLLDQRLGSGAEKYGLSQADFYQLQAYGQNYLDGVGDVVLIYPKTDNFSDPLPVFAFPKSVGLRLWVLPFCLMSRKLILPPEAPFATAFQTVSSAAASASVVGFADQTIPEETAPAAS